jgi:MFS family permease
VSTDNERRFHDAGHDYEDGDDERGDVYRTTPGAGEHVGIKWGAAFFGWLTALGLAVLLTALAAAVGAAVGVSTATTPEEAVDQAAAQPETLGLASGIVIGLIVFIAYFCGGYVAGRMARYDGLRQGLAVWLWAILASIAVAVAAAIAGTQYDVLAQLNTFPRLPFSEEELSMGGIIALVAFLVVSLAGALLGGLAGMRYHRRIDQGAVLR